jgi:hypothetical protein
VGYSPENAPLYADMGTVDYLFRREMRRSQSGPAGAWPGQEIAGWPASQNIGQLKNSASGWAWPRP